SKYKGCLRFFKRSLIYFFQLPFAIFIGFHKSFAVVNNTSFKHFTQQVIPFTRSLSDTGKDRQTAVSFGNIVNQLLNKNRFTYSCTAKQAGLTTFSIGTEQVNNLDSCLK